LKLVLFFCHRRHRWYTEKTVPCMVGFSLCSRNHPAPSLSRLGHPSFATQGGEIYSGSLLLWEKSYLIVEKTKGHIVFAICPCLQCSNMFQKLKCATQQKFNSELSAGSTNQIISRSNLRNILRCERAGLHSSFRYRTSLRFLPIVIRLRLILWFG
jgi:hypothetical protein